MANTTMVGDDLTKQGMESALATLQPIRDLSRNWDVDIASCLEEYLQELVGVSPSQWQQPESLDGSSTDATPNFAHAALILQNSSHVYGRKVEYLHSLVYKALYEFFKSTSVNSKDGRRKSTDASIDEFYDFDPNEDFLLLDDVVPEDLGNQKINLREDDQDGDINMVSGTPQNASMTRTRLSLGGLSVTRAERSSMAGFSLTSQRRALLGTLNSGSLRLVGGTCDVGDDGVLLMPGSQSSKPLSPIATEEVDEGRRSLFGEELQPMEQGFDDDDDHSNDGPGFAFNDDAGQDPASVDLEQGVTDTIGWSEQKMQSHGTKAVTFAATAKSKRADPWALLDPHSSEGNVHKPLKRGKTFRLPPGVDLPPSECVTGASTRQLPSQRPQRTKEPPTRSLIMDTFQYALGKSARSPKIPMNGLLFGGEFAYLAKEAARRRNAQRRVDRQARLAEQASSHQPTYHDNDDDDEYGGGYDFGGDDDYDDENNDIGNGGMTSLDEAFSSAADADSKSSNTFEELCRAHISAFAKGAEDFAFNTQLSDRVNKWQAKLTPILEEEERRSAFDIHKYSEVLIEAAQMGLQRLKRKQDGSTQVATKSVDFGSVARDCPHSDVCRLFLASLSLANSGNLHIDEGAPSYRFDLVSNSVDRPMETYRAPSLVDDS